MPETVTVLLVAEDALLSAPALRAAAQLVAGALPELACRQLRRCHLPEALAGCVAAQTPRVVILPLAAEAWPTADWERQQRELAGQFPGLAIEWLPPLSPTRQLQHLLFERLAPLAEGGDAQPAGGRAIEERSWRIIDRRLAAYALPPPQAGIVRRVIHATADFSFADTLRFHPAAVARGVAALRAGRPVICDVRMLQAAITRPAGKVNCALDYLKTAPFGGTRTAAAMVAAGAELAEAIVAIGNAPTALRQVMELAARGDPPPALVVGCPVGLVGAREAKQALVDSGLCYIACLGARGGSPVAAAVVNALALLSQEPP